MRVGACAGIAGIALAFLGFASAASSTSTDLRITVWPRGTQGRSLSWTLRCNPAGGTLPRPARACRVLASQSAPFRPVPSGTICTGIYGGRAAALVRGTFRGRRLRTWFKRTDGCQIARWNRVRVLFPIRVPAPT
jgi:Subtilisin inhibitor-like